MKNLIKKYKKLIIGILAYCVAVRATVYRAVFLLFWVMNNQSKLSGSNGELVSVKSALIVFATSSTLMFIVFLVFMTDAKTWLRSLPFQIPVYLAARLAALPVCFEIELVEFASLGRLLVYALNSSAVSLNAAELIAVTAMGIVQLFVIEALALGVRAIFKRIKKTDNRSVA